MEEQKILIADDAVFMRKMIRNTLAGAGYSCFIEAANGREALTAFDENHPDLTFLDITMPELSGLDVLKEIMARDPEAKVVMCSAVGQDSTIMDAIRTGASEFIVKPFRKDQLIEVVSSILG